MGAWRTAPQVALSMYTRHARHVEPRRRHPIFIVPRLDDRFIINKADAAEDSRNALILSLQLCSLHPRYCSSNNSTSQKCFIEFRGIVSSRQEPRLQDSQSPSRDYTALDA